MFKTLSRQLPVVILASAFAMGACSKKDKAADAPVEEAADKAEAVAKTAEAPAVKTAVKTEVDAPAEMAATADSDDAKPTMTVAQADEVLGFISKMSSTVTGAKGDCKKLAAEFNTLFDASKTAIAAGKAMDTNAANKKWFEEQYGEKMAPLVSVMMEGMSKCGGDADVQAALKKIEG